MTFDASKGDEFLWQRLQQENIHHVWQQQQTLFNMNCAAKSVTMSDDDDVCDNMICAKKSAMM